MNLICDLKFQVDCQWFLQIKMVVFDKTGTLTVGKPSVVSAVLFSEISMEEFCDLTIATEVRLCFILSYVV